MVKPCADKGEPVARTNLAGLLAKGKPGLQRDLNRAAALLQSAAEQGYGPAILGLALTDPARSPFYVALGALLIVCGGVALALEPERPRHVRRIGIAFALVGAALFALRDNLVRLEDTAAGYHERLMMAFDIYLNKAAFEANEGIKFLTAITAVTIPVMVIGTWFGMNFKTMPELENGYPWALGSTVVTTVLMVIYLKKKKWF